MKQNIAIGESVDLNVSLRGGEVDQGVTYALATSDMSIISVSSTGVITGLAAGTALVNIIDDITGRVLKTVVFSVYTPEQLQVKKDIAAGVLSVVATSDSSNPLEQLVSPFNAQSNISSAFRIYANNNAVPAYKVFNGSSKDNPCWNKVGVGIVGFKATVGRTVKKYTVQANGVALVGSVALDAPKEFKLQACTTWISETDFNDLQSTNWVTLDHQVDQSFNISEQKTFTINATTAYKNYRLVMLSSNDSSGKISLGDLRLFGFEETEGSLISPQVSEASMTQVNNNWYEGNGFTIFGQTSGHSQFWGIYRSPVLAFNGSTSGFSFFSRYGMALGFKSTETKVVTHYEITNVTENASDVTTYGSTAPKDFKLQGTNKDMNEEECLTYPGTDWTTIDDQTGVTFASEEAKVFSVSNAPPFKHYRLVVHASSRYSFVNPAAGGTEVIDLAELKIYGKDPLYIESVISPQKEDWTPGPTQLTSKSYSIGQFTIYGETNTQAAGAFAAPYKVFDGSSNPPTPYIDNFYARYNLIAGYVYNAPRVLTRYEIVSANETQPDIDTYGSTAPKNFWIQGTNADISDETVFLAHPYQENVWETVDIRTNFVFDPVNSTESFNVSNSTAYKHYRIWVWASHHANSWINLPELKLFGYDPDAPLGQT